MPSLSRSELGERLIEIAETADDGEPKTGRRYYYLAISYGYVRPDMSDTPAAKRSRDAAYDRVTSVLGILRKQGRIDWSMVLDLTREIDHWQTYELPRDARAAMRRRYTEDRWLGQAFYPVLIAEKDTLEPVLEPVARRWQMPFVSSRGYGSLKLQHDVAEMLRHRPPPPVNEPWCSSSAISTHPGSICNGRGKQRLRASVSTARWFASG